MKPWLEYRLERLAFHNGAELGFTRARMRYNPSDHVIAIEHLDASTSVIDDALRRISIAGDDGQTELPAIKTIYYEMRIEGYPPFAFFFHPVSRGAQIYLLPRQPGRALLHFMQRDERPMFSKNYTLREVTRGKVPSDRAVWQFHGYKHEH